MWTFRTLALYLSGTYCHKTGTRTPSCGSPRQPTIYTTMPTSEQTYHSKLFQFVQKLLKIFWCLHISGYIYVTESAVKLDYLTNLTS